MPLRPAETINHLPPDTCCPLRTLPLAGTRCCMVAAIDSNGSAHTPQTIPVAHRCPAFVRQPALVSAVGPAWSSVHTRSSHCTVRGGLTQHPHATVSWACAGSARARGAPGSIGTARLNVVATRCTAAYEVVSAVLALDERLPARPGGRGQAACRGRRAGSAPQPPRAPPEQCLRP